MCSLLELHVLGLKKVISEWNVDKHNITCNHNIQPEAIFHTHSHTNNKVANNMHLLLNHSGMVSDSKCDVFC